MGDRAQVEFITESKKIYFYTHYDGSDLENIVSDARLVKLAPIKSSFWFLFIIFFLPTDNFFPINTIKKLPTFESQLADPGHAQRADAAAGVDHGLQLSRQAVSLSGQRANGQNGFNVRLFAGHLYLSRDNLGLEVLYFLFNFIRNEVSVILIQDMSYPILF